MTTIECGTGNKPEPTPLSKICICSMSTNKSTTAQLTRHQIKVTQRDKIHNAQLIIHGHPIMMWQSTNKTWVFAQPRSTPNGYNTHRLKQTILPSLYKTEMSKLVQYRPMSIPDTQAMSHQTIVIGITSKQWGTRADFGWCTTYQDDNHEHPLAEQVRS
jgi:hypothetical protein